MNEHNGDEDQYINRKSGTKSPYSLGEPGFRGFLGFLACFVTCILIPALGIVQLASMCDPKVRSLHEIFISRRKHAADCNDNGTQRRNATAGKRENWCDSSTVCKGSCDWDKQCVCCDSHTAQRQCSDESAIFVPPQLLSATIEQPLWFFVFGKLEHIAPSD